ncbi:MAG: hypothetical protein AAB925_02855 [Patescibacteria group bacterium]
MIDPITIRLSLLGDALTLLCFGAWCFLTGEASLTRLAVKFRALKNTWAWKIAGEAIVRIVVVAAALLILGLARHYLGITALYLAIGGFIVLLFTLLPLGLAKTASMGNVYCPKCGSEEIDYGEPREFANRFARACRDCHTQF